MNFVVVFSSFCYPRVWVFFLTPRHKTISSCMSSDHIRFYIHGGLIKWDTPTATIEGRGEALRRQCRSLSSSCTCSTKATLSRLLHCRGCGTPDVLISFQPPVLLYNTQLQFTQESVLFFFFLNLVTGNRKDLHSRVGIYWSASRGTHIGKSVIRSRHLLNHQILDV